MYLIGYCAEDEKQNGCLGTKWLKAYQLFILMVAWLTASCTFYHCPASPENIVLNFDLSITQEKIKTQN